MRFISKVVKQIEEELKDAEKYIHCANEYPEYASQYKRLANAEIEHFQILHDMVVEIINNYKMDKEEIPKEMKAIWDYEHVKFVEWATELKYKITQIK